MLWHSKHMLHFPPLPNPIATEMLDVHTHPYATEMFSFHARPGFASPGFASMHCTKVVYSYLLFVLCMAWQSGFSRCEYRRSVLHVVMSFCCVFRSSQHGMDIVPFMSVVLDAPRSLDPHGNSVAMVVRCLCHLVTNEVRQ